MFCIYLVRIDTCLIPNDEDDEDDDDDDGIDGWDGIHA